MKYWRLKFEGERSAEEIQTDVGRSGATVLRIHVQDDATQVYVAAEESAREQVATASGYGSAPEEVSLEEVTKIG